MKKICLFILIGVMVLGLTGCGEKYPDLPADAIAFKTSEFVYENNGDDESFLQITYNGRAYIGYGELHNSLSQKKVDKCIGFIVRDSSNTSVVTSDKKLRVYTLTDDPDENYLMIYDTSFSLMNKPSFWRAVDTRGRNVKTPMYIGESDFAYWK